MADASATANLLHQSTPRSDAPELKRMATSPALLSDTTSPGPSPSEPLNKPRATSLELPKRRTHAPSLDLPSLAWRGAEWRWLNTVSFWIAASFSIGSVLFIVGAATSIAGPLLVERGWFAKGYQQRVLIDYAYAIGACYFEVGAYLGWFEVINVGKSERRLWAGPSEGVSLSGCTLSIVATNRRPHPTPRDVALRARCHVPRDALVSHRVCQTGAPSFTL
jgi:hypothetical protein